MRYFLLPGLVPAWIHMHTALTSVKAPANMQFPFHGEKDKYGSCTAKKVASPGFSSCWVCVAGKNLTGHLPAMGERKSLSFCMGYPWKLSGQINEHREMIPIAGAELQIRSAWSTSKDYSGGCSFPRDKTLLWVYKDFHLQDCNFSAFIGSCISA